MKKSRAILTFTAFLAVMAPALRTPLQAQAVHSLRAYENMIGTEEMQDIVSWLTDDISEGRASGTAGQSIAGQILVDKFRKLGLKPTGWTFTRSFRYKDSISLRNIVGLLPSAVPSDEYIVIGAHYDHLGRLGHSLYPGADDNASGVAALLSLAKMFAKMAADGRGPRKNLIFVAFDGKELNMAGSRHFVRHLPVPSGRITAMVNMDMLGTDLVPPRRNREYLFAIGEESLPEKYRGRLSYICSRTFYKMDLDLTFYGSRDFYQMMYRTGDQHPFAAAGIPAVLFTSAFHHHTYKKSDTIDIIDFPLLRKRTMVIFNFINHLCSE